MFLFGQNISINFGHCQIDFTGNATVQLNSPQGQQKLFCLAFFYANAACARQVDEAPGGVALSVPTHERRILTPELQRTGAQNFLKLTLSSAVQA